VSCTSGRVPDITMPALGDRTLRSVAEPWLITGAVLVAVVVATVVALPGWGYGGVAVVAMALATAMIVVGIVIHRPRRAVPWSLLAIGCLVHTSATAVLAIRTQGGTTDGPGLPQAIAVLAYPLLFVGVAGLTTRRESAWSVAPPTAIASAAVGTAVTALAFTLPYLLRDELPLAESDWVGVLALGDFVIALMAVRCIFGAPHRNWSRWLLVAGFVAWGNAHAEVEARIHDGAYDGGSRIGLTLVVGPLLVGLAGLLPSMADVPAPRPHGERQAEATNWAWLVSLPPALIVVVHAAEVNASRLWIILPLALVATWAVGRMAALIGRLDDPDGGLGNAAHEALDLTRRYGRGSGWGSRRSGP